MYKTIRHGENSLQYTILPQNDDFKVDGKLTSASSKDIHNRQKPKRSTKRRSFFAYLGLLFVCTVIVGAVLIPFLVSAECLPNPSDWFLKTKAALTSSAKRLGESFTSSTTSTATSSGNPTIVSNYSNKNHSFESTSKPYHSEGDNIVLSHTGPPYVYTEPKTTPAGDDINNGGGSNTNQTPVSNVHNDFIAEVRFEDIRGETSTIAPTIVVTTVRTDDYNKSRIIQGVSLRADTTLSTTTNSSPTVPGIGQGMMTRIMQAPLLKSPSKKPIIPPVLAKTNSLGQEDINKNDFKDGNKEKVNLKQPSYWIRSHWAYIDPSTYFQWMGYKAEDSVLLPAILGVALIVIILVSAVCLMARNKGTNSNPTRKRNRDDIEEAGDDKTTLLTTSNLSDEE